MFALFEAFTIEWDVMDNRGTNDIVLIDLDSSAGGRTAAGNNNQEKQVTASDVNYRVVEMLLTNWSLLDPFSDLGCSLYSQNFESTKLHVVSGSISARMFYLGFYTTSKNNINNWVKYNKNIAKL